MKSCLYCGVVDICENFNNATKTFKTILNYIGYYEIKI